MCGQARMADDPVNLVLGPSHCSEHCFLPSHRLGRVRDRVRHRVRDSVRGASRRSLGRLLVVLYLIQASSEWFHRNSELWLSTGYRGGALENPCKASYSYVTPKGAPIRGPKVAMFKPGRGCIPNSQGRGCPAAGTLCGPPSFKTREGGLAMAFQGESGISRLGFDRSWLT